jgi:prepilin-type N-terminal cleavage/methylation domain-containing protein
MVIPECGSRRRIAPAGARDRTGRSPGGFSLVEVLIAMLILAVGLLALQALTIASLRAGGQADQNTRAVASATRFLEGGMSELRQGRLPAPFDCTLANGDVVVRTSEILDDPNLAVVQVQVTPETPGSPAVPHTLSTYVYSADGFSAPEAAFACP